MSSPIYLTGQTVIAEQNTAASINSAYTLSADSAYPTKWTGTTANGATASGAATLHIFFNWDGTHGARFTLNGTTTPTTTVGHLVPTEGVLGAAGTTTELIIRGQSQIANFKAIGTGSGITVTWYICVDDDR